MREYLQAKIHKATVTETNLNYVWSITIDEELLQKVDIHVGQKVLVTNITNWSRLETYVIAGKKWEICMNWPTAHLFNVGDEVIIMWFEFSENPISSKVILVNKDNSFQRFLSN